MLLQLPSLSALCRCKFASFWFDVVDCARIAGFGLAGALSPPKFNFNQAKPESYESCVLVLSCLSVAVHRGDKAHITRASTVHLLPFEY